MNWIPINSPEQLEEIRIRSVQTPQLIFKHSTRCVISVMIKNRLERSEMPSGVDFYYLDLLQYRPISNLIADSFSVHHQSPQILLIQNGECVYEESQNAITMDEIIEQIKN
jgi:bacillithiol system protein YtxJ